MKMKYCPECGSIQLQSNGNGMQCKKCSYLGDMKEDSIDIINSFIAAKRNQPADSSSTSVFHPKTVSQKIENKKEINPTVNKNPVQNISSFNSTTVMRQENKPESLKERLKKFESNDVEIL